MSTTILDAVASANSWVDIQSLMATLPEKAKGDAFEDLTQAYLQIAPEYVSRLKHVWRLEEVPQTVRRKLRLPDTDRGIDLVAETHKGEYWAVQCKYRTDTDRQLTHTDISTFTSLTFHSCKGFSFALVCSTTERVTQLYRSEERIGFLALDTWQGLDQEFFQALKSLLRAKNPKPEPRTPRPHQVAAVKDGIDYFKKGKAARGKLIMPCGTGKSLTAWFLAESLGYKSVLIAVPSLSLVRQTLKVWLRETTAHGLDVDWICVCSDESAGRADQDDVVVHRQDLAVPCLTSKDKIVDWLQTRRKGRTVLFTTYQSGDVLAAAARKAKVTFDLGIMDEAHKTVGDSDKQFSHLLHDINIKINRRIFMTATERRYKGNSDKVLSMDDRNVYGDTFHQLSFKQAMDYQTPILCDYHIVTIGVTTDEIRALIRKNVFVRAIKGKWDEEIEADMLAALVALRKAMTQCPITHAVSFHSSIQRAELFRQHNDAFTKEFPAFGDLAAFHVSGRTPTGTRSRIIQEFASLKRSLVTNARCLTEGVDVPGIDCVLFADPRRSTIDIVQAVGRALRPSEGKKLGYVILPILHDSNASSQEIVESGAFKDILSTISALAANDDRIIEYFRGVSQGRSSSGPSRVRFDWEERLAQNIDVAKLVHELEIKCWGRLAKLTWRRFEEARAFAGSLGLKGQKDWADYCAGRISGLEPKPEDIPSNPQKTYLGRGWISFGDWLGTGNVRPKDREYLPFAQARTYARQLRLGSGREWRLYCVGKLPNHRPKPDNIPTDPRGVYREEGWIGMGDWLGTGNLRPSDRQYATFEEARRFARSLKLTSGAEWRHYCKGQMRARPQKPDNIPGDPRKVYKGKGWKSMGDWLGTGNTRYGSFLPFKKARTFARSLKLSSAKKWFAFCKGEVAGLPSKPPNIPFDPQRIYKDVGWINWGDWLGTGTISNHHKTYMPFDEARQFVRRLNIASGAEWLDYCKGKAPGRPKKPEEIPTYPAQTYKDAGWMGMRDWLGNEDANRR